MTILETDRRLGAGLEVLFVWRDDRYHQTVNIVSGPERLPLLSSVEGDDQTIWPSSPPFRQVAVEQHATSRVALLVGMAGKSHWSASIHSPVGESRLLFDVACLARQAPLKLGSCYRLNAEPVDLTHTSLLLSTPAGNVQLQTIAGGPWTPRLFVQDGNASIGVDLQPAVEVPQTYRWRYELALQQGLGGP